jgi:RNA polymerase sigma-70 factor (ECF subfamily)
VGDSGEEEFERFVRERARSLMRQAYLLTGDAGEAQDLVQETMIRAWREWPKIRAYEDPGAWTRRVLHHLAIGRWRRLTVRRRHDEADLRVAPGLDAQHLDVLAALRVLPMDQRRALVLHDIAGLSVSEVATDMGVPEGTVRSWLSRARGQVARDLGIAGVVAEQAEGQGS